jgi:SAM-dependent methyltransferase
MGTMAAAETWDRIWDDIHRRRAWGKYPKEELIRFVAQNYYAAPDRKAVRFLDLGCGFGASTWYLAREGFTVDAIDGSAVVIERLRKRLAEEGLPATLAIGDIVDLPYPKNTFDCVVDIACLMCNTPDDTRRILDGVHDRLKVGGRLFSIAATPDSTGAGIGERIAEGTYRSVTEGSFADVGTVRFSSREAIQRIYARFSELRIDLSEYTLDGGATKVSNWVIEGRKA